MSSDSAYSAPPGGKLLALAQLCRLPNLFTALADVTMGYAFAHPTLEPRVPWFCLLGASSLLYTAGMVLNDVYDIDVDREERPGRPLPSGRIAVNTARRLGYRMLAAGVLLGWLAGYLVTAENALAWRPGLVATVLAAMVLVYDAVVKNTPLGPWAMGSCRFLNVLLGMSFAAPFPTAWPTLGYGPHQLLVAAGIGLYIVGVTWFARSEAETSSRLQLTLGVVLMLGGLSLLAIFPRFCPLGMPLRFPPDSGWLLLLMLLTLTIVRRCLVAIGNPTATNVQTAVKNSILSLIVLDAAVALEVSSTELAVGILFLLAPTLLLGKWVYST